MVVQLLVFIVAVFAYSVLFFSIHHAITSTHKKPTKLTINVVEKVTEERTKEF